MPQTVSAADAPSYGFSAFNRPLGIGLLLGGAIMGIVVSLPVIKEAFRSIAAASKLKGGGDELGLRVLVTAVVLAVALLFAAAYVVGEKPFNRTCPVTGQWVGLVSVADVTGNMTEAERRVRVDRLNREVDALETATRPYGGYIIRLSSEAAARTWDGYDDGQRDAYLLSVNARKGWLAGLPSIVRAAIIALVGVAWIWFAGIIIAQCTGLSDWSPISGMALLTVVLVMLLAGTGAVVGAVLIGAALCVAITLAADMMQDLRTGHLVGAQPKRQAGHGAARRRSRSGDLDARRAAYRRGESADRRRSIWTRDADVCAPGASASGGHHWRAGRRAAVRALRIRRADGRPPRSGQLQRAGGDGRSEHVSAVRRHRHVRHRVRHQHGRVELEGVASGPRTGACRFAAGLIVGESVLAMVINMIVLATG